MTGQDTMAFPADRASSLTALRVAARRIVGRPKRILVALVLFFTAFLSAAGAQDSFNCEKAAGFVGTLCVPTSAGKHPALLLLGGSGGGDHLAPFASRFAARGYVAGSVAYFGLPGLPSRLELIPVEIVGNALDRIAERADVDPERVGILGVSKGGEFALLAASTYPRIGAVVSIVGSPFAWSRLPRGPREGFASSWTAAGKITPFAPVERLAMRSSGWEGYEASIRQNRVAVERAMFRLENVRGPILFLAAGDDRVWDSKTQAEIGMAYLKAHQHVYADKMVSYPSVGHAFMFGGSPAVAELAWPEIDTFLAKALTR
jgi:dienelactone hydrolase